MGLKPLKSLFLLLFAVEIWILISSVGLSNSLNHLDGFLSQRSKYIHPFPTGYSATILVAMGIWWHSQSEVEVQKVKWIWYYHGPCIILFIF